MQGIWVRSLVPEDSTCCRATKPQRVSLCATITESLGFRGGSDSKENACNVGDLALIPGLGRYPEEGNGYPLQYSALENSMEELDTTEGLTVSVSYVLLYSISSEKFTKTCWMNETIHPNIHSICFLNVIVSIILEPNCSHFLYLEGYFLQVLLESQIHSFKKFYIPITPLTSRWLHRAIKLTWFKVDTCVNH